MNDWFRRTQRPQPEETYSAWLYARFKKENQIIPPVDKIIYNLKGKTTIVYFKDGDKVIVRCSKYERFDKETGLAMAFMKKMFKSRNEFKRLVASGKIQD